MTVALAIPIRTQVRDIVVSALQTLDDMPTVRVKGAEIVKNYLAVDEIKKDASYGVIVTHEAIEVTAQFIADVQLTVMVVIHVKSTLDVRAMLDNAIEDVWEVLRSGQLVKSVVPYLVLQSIETDEGTTIVKPFAQAIMKWTAHVRRDVSW